MTKITINSAWIRDAKTEEERERIYKEVINSNFLLDKLRKICYNISIELEEVSSPDYDSASWSHKQAHRNGQLDILRKLNKILEVKASVETETDKSRTRIHKKS